MKFKSENGFTGIDITVAIIVILLFMSLISILFFNITKSSKSIDRKSEATYIATTIIEGFKSKNYNDVKVTGENIWVEVKNSTNLEGNKIISYDDIEITDLVQIKDGYTCEVNVYNHVPEDKKIENDESNDLLKVVTVRVRYKVGKQIEKVELTTSIVREF